MIASTIDTIEELPQARPPECRTMATATHEEVVTKASALGTLWILSEGLNGTQRVAAVSSAASSGKTHLIGWLPPMIAR